MFLRSEDEEKLCEVIYSINRGGSYCHRAENELAKRYLPKVESHLKQDFPRIDCGLVANEACLKAIEYARKHLVKSFCGVVFRIAYRLAYEYLRQGNPHEGPYPIDMDGKDVPSPIPPLPVQVEQRLMFTMLQDAIANCLTEYERMVWVQFNLEPYSVKEIASFHGKTEGAIRQTVHHSNGKLNDYLSEWREGGERL